MGSEGKQVTRGGWRVGAGRPEAAHEGGECTEVRPAEPPSDTNIQARGMPEGMA